MQDNNVSNGIHKKVVIVDKTPNYWYWPLFAVGVVLLLLGGFMVTNVYALNVFSTWLPLVTIATGVLLLGSRYYSTTLGFVLLAFGGAIWLHEVGIGSFPYLTRLIDWLFVIVGGAIIAVALIKISIK